MLPVGSAPLSGSRSEQHLAMGHRSGRSSGSRTPTYYSDDEEKSREEKKAQVKNERKIAALCLVGMIVFGVLCFIGLDAGFGVFVLLGWLLAL